MTPTQVFRFETRDGLQGQLVAHVDGTTRPETALSPMEVALRDRAAGCPDSPGAVVHLGGVGMAAGRVRLRELLASAPTRGRPPKQALDVLLAGPAAYGDGAWSVMRELEWARDAYEALRELVGPNSVIVSADLHRDESSAHVQAIVIPVDSEGRLGWCRVRDEAAKRVRPEVRKARREALRRVQERREAGEDVDDPPQLSTRSRYGVLQDWVYYQVSRPFGLGRGEVGSEATHAQVDRQQAADAALRQAQQLRDQAEHDASRLDQEREAIEQRHADLRRESAAAEKARDQARAEAAVARTERDQALEVSRTARDERAAGWATVWRWLSARGRQVLDQLAATRRQVSQLSQDLSAVQGRLVESQTERTRLATELQTEQDAHAETERVAKVNREKLENQRDAARASEASAQADRAEALKEAKGRGFSLGVRRTLEELQADLVRRKAVLPAETARLIEESQRVCTLAPFMEIYAAEREREARKRAQKPPTPQARPPDSGQSRERD